MLVERTMVSESVLLISTLSLIIELVVLGLLIFAYVLRGKKLFRQHGITMTSAVALHIITILAVMLPSFSTFFTPPGTISSRVIDPIVIVSFIHVALGLTAVAIGTWLVASWHFKTDLQTCFANEKKMKPTLALWVTAILLGIIMYVTFWASLLLS